MLWHLKGWFVCSTQNSNKWSSRPPTKKPHLSSSFNCCGQLQIRMWTKFLKYIHFFRQLQRRKTLYCFFYPRDWRTQDQGPKHRMHMVHMSQQEKYWPAEHESKDKELLLTQLQNRAFFEDEGAKSLLEYSYTYNSEKFHTLHSTFIWLLKLLCRFCTVQIIWNIDLIKFFVSIYFITYFCLKRWEISVRLHQPVSSNIFYSFMRLSCLTWHFSWLCQRLNFTQYSKVV